MNYWIEDHMGWIISIVTVLLFASALVLGYYNGKERDERFHQLLSMSQTRQDSLNVMLTFEKLKSDDDTRAAIISAGVIAGSNRR